MDQFSHDLAVALEETSLLDRARVSRWGRRRTASTGNLPCAPQPTEDSSTDTAQPGPSNPNDGLASSHVLVPSDSDDKEEAMRLPRKSKASICLGILESDSLNEAFSPARFFKPNARRKRKLKRMSVEYEMAGSVAQTDLMESSLLTSTGTGTIRKRLLKPEPGSRSSNLFFCGKRKRSNRDRYHDQEQGKAHSSSMPRHTYLDDYRMRPRSYSSTSKPRSERLLPLNKGLVSKIERISQQQKTDSVTEVTELKTSTAGEQPAELCALDTNAVMEPHNIESPFHAHRKKSNRAQRRTQLQQLQFAVDQHPMDCGELNDFLSSSSLSSSESDDEHAANDTDREGDDELTDWPGNEGAANHASFDPKRKLTKKSNLPQIKSEDGVASLLAEDDTLMSGSGEWESAFDAHEPLEMRYQPSEPIAIATKSAVNDVNVEMALPLKQIESEMSGETSNPFLASPPTQNLEVREIRAGCRRIKGERPGFSIKTSVNERLSRFLQDPRQLQIRLPDLEIYEHDSLISLATLYSLQMSLDNGCAVLTKTSKTTQSVNIDQQSLQSRLFLSDFKRRCYDGNESFVPRK